MIRATALQVLIAPLQLYDLSSGPGEMINVAGRNLELVAEMQAEAQRIVIDSYRR